MRLPWQRGGDEADETVARSATAARDDRLSEYLDGFLSRPDRAAIEADAERDSDTRIALEGMRAIRSSLGELGIVRAPRSFALAPQMAPRQFGLPRLELYARLATAAAALVLAATSLVPAFTGSLDERSGTSVSESFDAAQAPTEASKQAADQSPQVAPAAAPAGVPAAPPRTGAPSTEGATSTASGAAKSVPELPSLAEQPVPLSNGPVDSAGSGLWGTQFAAAVATAAFAALAIGLWLRRRAQGGV